MLQCIVPSGARTIVTLLALLLLAGLASGQGTVSLVWDPSPDANVVGYRIYYGAVSQNYTNSVSATNTSATVGGLLPGVTYFFAATAYDALGSESDFSNEVSFTVPSAATSARLTIGLGTGGSLLLNGYGQGGMKYNVLASVDFTSWSVVATLTAGTDGSFQYNLPISPTNRFCAFYAKLAP